MGGIKLDFKYVWEIFRNKNKEEFSRLHVGRKGRLSKNLRGAKSN